MRVLFTTTAGAGHFNPMVPIAHACLAAGEDVAVAAPASFADSVRGAGLDHLPFPDVPREVMGAVFGRLPELTQQEADRVVVAEVFGRLDAQAALPTMIEIVATWRPALLVRDCAEFGGLIAAERAGIPQVQVGIDMGGLLPKFAAWLDDPIRELEDLAGLAPALGTERVLRTATLTSVPAALEAATPVGAGPVWRFRSVPEATGPSLPGEWGDPAYPLVYVTFGSVTGTVGPFGAVYPVIMEVLAELPVRVLMTTGAGYDRSALGPIPANTWVAPWWPQAAVMREAALVVGHGGFGTTMTALAAGVPQLVVPLFSSDQFLNAERVEAVGAGLRLVDGLAAMDQVQAAVAELLAEPRYADAARSVAAEIAALPDVSTMVPVLRELAGR